MEAYSMKGLFKGGFESLSRSLSYSMWNFSTNKLLFDAASKRTFEKYFTTSKNYVMADKQPGTWLCKVHIELWNYMRIATTNQKLQEAKLQPMKKYNLKNRKVKFYREKRLLKRIVNQYFDG